MEPIRRSEMSIDRSEAVVFGWVELAQHHLRPDVVLDPGLTREPPEADPPRPGERVTWRCDHDDLVVPQVGRSELGVAREPGRRVGDHGGIELPAQHHRPELRSDPRDHRALGATAGSESGERARHE